jgi:hypothetical protein
LNIFVELFVMACKKKKQDSHPASNCYFKSSGENAPGRRSFTLVL